LWWLAGVAVLITPLVALVLVDLEPQLLFQ
jgi:hypothetical protein